MGEYVPRSLVVRQDRPHDARGQLHGFVQLERPRQERHCGVGESGDRLSGDGAGYAGLRAARLSARDDVLVVSLQSAPREVPVYARGTRGSLA